MPLKRTDAEIAFADDRMAKVNLFETPRFFCDLYCLRPGQAQKPHRHAVEDKVYHVLRGEVVFRDGDRDLAGSPGDTVWCPAGEEHGVSNPGPADAVVLVFMAPHPRLGGGAD